MEELKILLFLLVVLFTMANLSQGTDQNPLTEEKITNQRAKRHDLPGMAKFCRNKVDAKLYEDKTNCRAYIYCSGGYAYRAECPAGLYYNNTNRQCDYDYGACAGKTRGTSNRVPLTSTHTDHATEKTYNSETTRHPHSSSGYSKHNNYYGANINSIEGRIADASHKTGSEVDSLFDNLSTDVDDMDKFCAEKSDGTYAHPYDCQSYVLCSHSYAFPVKCPEGLVFIPEQQGCDYDKTNVCANIKARTALPGGTSRNAGTTRANYIPRYSSDSPQRRNKGLKDASSAMPRAVEQAMTSLMKQLQREADIANSITGRKRPFRMVQKFLKAKPIAKHMSMPAFIITNASAILMEELGMAGGDSNNMAILQSMGSPLSANTHLLAPDEPFPIPEAGSCPWPRYACRGNVPYRSFDGSCNNLQNPLWGRSFTPVTRFLPPQYGDDIQSFRRARDGSELPGARKVSFSINEDRDSPHHIHSAMLLQFGQFLDHDMTLTAISKIPSDPTGMGETVDIECGEDGCATHLDACKPIIIPHNDPDFHTEKCLEFVRSQGVPNLKCSMGPIQQLNQLTAYIDGSNVYGSTKQENDKLRHPDKRRGMLRWMDHPSGGKHKYMLPTTSEDSECNEFQQSPCFLAGDERVNEQNALTAMHTIWFREHNWIEKHLHHINPQWGGDKLFQETRKIIGAMLQHIAFNEFLPIVLGPIQMERLQLKLQEQGHYNGYDATVNAGIASSFATAAYRFGHSLLIPKFHRLDENYKTMASLHLSQILFRPHRLMDTGGVDSFMRGLCETKVQTVDRFITKEATTKLFSEQPPSGLGTDLVSLNIQRGRDHGVPGYNAFREWCGMPRARDFNDLTEIKDPAVRVKFRKLYKHVDDIDLFPAGLSEAPVEGGLVGPTFACIIGRQFRNLRKGDRHWYENPGPSGFSIGQLAEIKKVRLARVVCRNGDAMGQVQPSVMLLPFREAYPNGIPHGGQHGLNTEWFSQLYASDFNAHVNCSCLPDLDLTKWKQ